MINYRGLVIPYYPMGKVSSDDLFGPNEQVIFDFYECSAGRYRRAVDVGANIGVHSILMARCGWTVRAFEPDPALFERLVENVEAHEESARVYPLCVAVSDRDGTSQFVRVLNNRTSSHLVGAKKARGPTEVFPVPVVDCRPLIDWADFVKIDCEGHEAVIITAVAPEKWLSADALLEVGSVDAAYTIWAHLRGAVPMWSQRTGWRRVLTLMDMPVHHTDGSLFIGAERPSLAEGGLDG